MGRILKVLGLVIGALIVLLAVILVGVSLLIDPNDYKDEIATAVNDATGRTLTLEGDLDLKLFPRLGIEMGAAELSNAEGFGDEPFARMEGAELRVGLLPLLSKRIEIDRASLSGLRLNLERNAAGVTNWDDLARGGEAAADEPDAADAGAGSDVDLSIAAMAVADAEVSWSDATAGQDWVLSNFNLEATELGPGRAFPLTMAFDLAGADMNVSVESEMVASITLATSTYRLDDLSVSLEGEGPGWPEGADEIELAFSSLIANLDDQSVVLDGLELEALGLSVSGNLEGENIMDDLSLAGGIEIAEFDPRELMSAFDANIETADGDVLGRASARAQFYYTSAGMGMRDMTLILDDSTLTGAAGLAGERVEFDLTVDSINIDRYLPPAESEPTDSPDEGSIDEVDLPLDPLRNFQADGELAINDAKFLGMAFSNLNFALDAGNGRMTLAPTGALYDGSLDGLVTIELQGEDAARFALRAAIENVAMAGLARDFLNLDSLEGTGNVALDLAAVGSQVGAIKRDLDGTASVEMTDGAWLGIDVWNSIRKARAVAGGPEVPPLEGEPRTTFDRIAIAGPVENAVLSTTELVARLPFAALEGQGTIDLLSFDLDLRAGAQLVDGPTLQQDPTIAGLAGYSVPLTIGGTIDAPDIGVDWSGLLASVARDRAQQEIDEAEERVNQQVEEQREEIEQEVEQELDEARDELEDRLRDRLRGLD